MRTNIRAPRRLLSPATAVLCLVGVTSAAAQVELGVGLGAAANRLDLAWRDVGQAGVMPRTFIHQSGTLTAGYRPHERFATRLAATVTTRRVDPAFTDPTGQRRRLHSAYLELGLEAAYYPNRWWSVGAGLGYARASRDRGLEQDLTSSFRPPTSELGLRSFGVAHLALEAYMGPVTLRVRPSASLTPVVDEALQVGPGGQVFSRRVAARWLGLDASLLARIPIGRADYTPAITFDSLLNRGTEVFELRLQRWGFGLGGSADATWANLGGEGGDTDDLRLQPRRLRLGLQSTYRLDDYGDWRLRASVGLSDFRSVTYVRGDGDPIDRESETHFSGVDALAGVEHRAWRRLRLGVDVGPTQVFGRFTSNGPAVGSREGPPIREVIWYGRGLAAWQFGERLRLGATASVTLNNPNGEDADVRLAPARPRGDRWLSLGVDATWMIVRG